MKQALYYICLPVTSWGDHLRTWRAPQRYVGISVRILLPQYWATPAFFFLKASLVDALILCMFQVHGTDSCLITIEQLIPIKPHKIIYVDKFYFCPSLKLSFSLTLSPSPPSLSLMHVHANTIAKFRITSSILNDELVERIGAINQRCSFISKIFILFCYLMNNFFRILARNFLLILFIPMFSHGFILLPSLLRRRVFLTFSSQPYVRRKSKISSRNDKRIKKQCSAWVRFFEAVLGRTRVKYARMYVWKYTTVPVFCRFRSDKKWQRI